MTNDNADKELLQELIKPYDESDVIAYPIPRLKGKMVLVILLTLFLNKIIQVWAPFYLQNYYNPFSRISFFEPIRYKTLNY